MEKVDIDRKREDIERMREEIYAKAIKGKDEGFFWDLTELANRLELDMIFNQGENKFDFKIFLDLTKYPTQRVSRFVTYMREYLSRFCNNRMVTISVRVE